MVFLEDSTLDKSTQPDSRLTQMSHTRSPVEIHQVQSTLGLLTCPQILSMCYASNG